MQSNSSHPCYSAGSSIIGNHDRVTGCFIRESAGTIGLIHNRPQNPASLENLRKEGFNGKVQDGRNAIRRAQRGIEDAEALEFRPRYLFTLTLPFDISAAEWLEAKSRFRTSLSRLLNKHGGGCYWWQGFQGNGRPHLHLLTDIGLSWDELLEWAETHWENALGRVCQDNTVDLKHCDSFDYARGRHAFAQAVAPSRDNWGKWRGFMGTWLEAKRQAGRHQPEVALEADEAEELIQGIEVARQKSNLPDWLSEILERFTRGYHRAVWIAKRFLGDLFHQVIDRFRADPEER